VELDVKNDLTDIYIYRACREFVATRLGLCEPEVSNFVIVMHILCSGPKPLGAAKAFVIFNRESFGKDSRNVRGSE
jgi:hypothetical protein